MWKIHVARHTFLIVALLVLPGICSRAYGEPFDIWRGSMFGPTPDSGDVFRFATGPDAYFEHSIGDPNRRFWTATDGPNVAALFADMTDGDNDPITWSSSVVSHTMDENLFFTSISPPGPLRGGSAYPELMVGRTDLAGFTIQWLEVEVTGFETSESRYSVIVHGRLPEPSSGLLTLIGLCGVHFRMGVRRRLTGC